MSEEVAGPVIAQLIIKEVERSQAAAASLQSRGLAVISSWGTLVTLLFGLSAVVTNVDHFELPSATKIALIGAACLLVFAAVAGIAANAPRRKHAIGLDGLAPLLEDELWTAKAKNALQATALEIAGVACITWAVIALIGG